MKILFPAMLFLGCAECGAATPSAQAIDACLKTDSVQAAHYTEFSVTNFNVEEDEVLQRTSTTFKRRGQTMGLWESEKPKDFGLVYNTSIVTHKNIIAMGADRPVPFDPYTAQWGEVRHRRNRHLCITFNFPGLGESGSFQNVRGLYMIDVARPAKFYYTVGDIRKIKN